MVTAPRTRAPGKRELGGFRTVAHDIVAYDSRSGERGSPVERWGLVTMPAPTCIRRWVRRPSDHATMGRGLGRRRSSMDAPLAGTPLAPPTETLSRRLLDGELAVQRRGMQAQRTGQADGVDAGGPCLVDSPCKLLVQDFPCSDQRTNLCECVDSGGAGRFAGRAPARLSRPTSCSFSCSRCFLLRRGSGTVRTGRPQASATRFTTAAAPTPVPPR